MKEVFEEAVAKSRRVYKFVALRKGREERGREERGWHKRKNQKESKQRKSFYQVCLLSALRV